MKLTALFTAQRGRPFLSSLSAREGRNYQFDFLRPTHSLFGYFNRLVEQYTKVLHPDAEMLDQLKGRADEQARWRALEVAKKHAKWERTKRERTKKREDDQEAEQSELFTAIGLGLGLCVCFTVAFAEIDWHDYAIVQTIEFTMADATTELPPPMSIQEVESMTLAQKRMAAMILEDTADDVEAHRARQAAAEAEAAAAVGSAGIGGNDDDAAMEESDDEEEIAKKQEVLDRQKQLEMAKANAAGGGMKIRSDYVPKRTFSSLLGLEYMLTFDNHSRCEEQDSYDELQHLWTTNSCGRTARAHAYRVTRSQMERAARCIGSSQGASIRATTGSKCRFFAQESRTNPCGYLRC